MSLLSRFFGKKEPSPRPSPKKDAAALRNEFFGEAADLATVEAAAERIRNADEAAKGKEEENCSP